MPISPHTARNADIYYARKAKETFKAIAERYSISPCRARDIFNREEEKLKERERAKRARPVFDSVKAAKTVKKAETILKRLDISTPTKKSKLFHGSPELIARALDELHTALRKLESNTKKLLTEKDREHTVTIYEFESHPKQNRKFETFVLHGKGYEAANKATAIIDEKYKGPQYGYVTFDIVADGETLYYFKD